MANEETMQLTFGKALRFRRLKLGLTQKDLADRMNVSQNTLSRWESMGDAPRDPYVISRLSELLYADPEDLRQGKVRKGRREEEEVHDQLVRIAMTHADNPEEVQLLVSIIEKSLRMNPEGLRRIEDLVSVFVDRFSKPSDQEEGGGPVPSAGGL